VNNSIGSGSENSRHMDKMNTILRLSYNDLPFHLKTCLLSLSKYPEDQVIRKDILVWSWIAEGFITPAGSSLQETWEGYFNELINRSLILPMNDKYHFYPLGETEVCACQIHDMVLELIVKLSAEEGFGTTALSDGEQAGASSLHQREITRRLALVNPIQQSTTSSHSSNRSVIRSLPLSRWGPPRSTWFGFSFHTSLPSPFYF